MMNSTNKLSVIIPLYNAGDDFRTCMESLITQTWTALEIIIINDGSTDNSVEIAKALRRKLSARSFVASGECWRIGSA